MGALWVTLVTLHVTLTTDWRCETEASSTQERAWLTRGWGWQGAASCGVAALLALRANDARREPQTCGPASPAVPASVTSVEAQDADGLSI